MDSPSPSRRDVVVLVVDDDPTMRFLLAQALSRQAADRVLEAEDGLAAQKILREVEVDVVVTDLVMPNMSGFDLIRWGRDACPGPVWVVNSGVDTFEMAAEAVELGVFSFLPKPRLSLDAVRMTVRRAAEHRALLREREELGRELRQRVRQLEQLCGVLQRQAEVIRADLHRAEEIQRALLPRRPPRLEGWSVHALCRPSQYVGGDLYDIARVADDVAAFYVADSAGHGVAAAMLSVLLKHRLRALDAAGRPRSPGVVLRTLNAAMRAECADRGLFVSLAYGVLHVPSGELVMASAGHPPALVRRSDGQVEPLAMTGPALGLEDDARFGERRLRLDKGDRLLLFTDGLLCPRNGNPARSADEIARVLAGTPAQGAELLDLLHPAQAQAGEDDVTMLLLTAGDEASSLDNGSDASGATSTPAATQEADLLRGARDRAVFVSVRGRGVWTQAEPFHRTCRSAIEERRPLEVDLHQCPYLDSTFLGTLHEVVETAGRADVPVRILGAAPPVLDLFRELHLTGVLARVSDEAPVPPDLLENVGPMELLAAQERVANAHEALASIDEENRRQFAGVLDALRSDPG